MRSFLLASMLAAGGFFGFTNVIEPLLESGVEPQVVSTKPAAEALAQAQAARTAGDLQTAEVALRKALELGAPVLGELTTLMRENGHLRGALTLEYERARDDVPRQQVLRQLDELNARVFNPNDIFGGERYIIRAGDTLAKIAKAKGGTDRLLQRINDIKNPNRIHAGQAIKVVTLKLHCQVSLSQRELRAYCEDGLFKVYSVGVGATQQPTPVGHFTVAVLQKHPPFWAEAGKPPIPAGDPRNPLGTRWMGFADPYSSYGVHGTNQDESIGQASSKGCVRMSRQDVEELFDLGDYGMEIVIEE